MAEAQAPTAPGAGAATEGKTAPPPVARQAGPPKIPLTFERWFWTADYRKGVTTLFTKLQTGLHESDELMSFIRSRISHERGFSNDLRGSLSPLSSSGFGADDGASLLAAFRQLQSSQAELASAHGKVARQLERNVLGPFEGWSIGHEERVRASIGEVEAVLGRWEGQAREVAKLKERYERKGREADDAEDEARFAPVAASPPITSPSKHVSFFTPLVKRSDSTAGTDAEDDDTLIGHEGVHRGEGVAALGKMVGEQAVGLGRALSQRVRTGGGRVGFRATSLDVPKGESDNATLTPVDTSVSEKATEGIPASPSEITPTATTYSASEKGKAKELDPTTTGTTDPAKRPIPETKDSLFVGDASPAPNAGAGGVANPGGVKLLEIAGIVRAPYEWSRLFAKARDTVYKQSVKVPLLGTYEGAQDGESIVIFFKRNVPELEGDDEWAIRFCKELSEDLSILRLIGEIGNKFMASPDAYYLWKPEAFQLHQMSATSEAQDFSGTYTALPDRHNALPHSPRPGSPTKRSRSSSPVKRAPVNAASAAPAAAQRAPLADYIRTAMTSSAFQKAMLQARQGITDLSTQVASATGATSPPVAGETRHERLRREALSAEAVYASAVRALDRSRLHLEETISEHLQFLQRCELDRLRASKAVVAGFSAAISTLAPTMRSLDGAAAVAHESLSPEADVAALVERHRTGPFRPSPQVFQCHWGELVNVTFGVDLRRWFDGQEEAAAQGKEVYQIPPVLTALLGHLESRYPHEESQAERRKWWIYEVPLRAVHALRESIIDPEKPIRDEILARVDGPVIAATVKLWLLELDPPPVPTQRYDEVRLIFTDSAIAEDERAGALKSILAKLPKVHLLVLDAVVSHLKGLLESTKTEEEEDVFLMKLGLSMARALLRPQAETPVSLSGRFQPLFLIELIKRYDDILPPAIEHQKQTEAERMKPKRQRTRPVDMRVRRSALGGASPAPAAAQRLLEKQRRRASGESQSPLIQPTTPLSPAAIPEEAPPRSEPAKGEPTKPKTGEPEDLPFIPPTSSAGGLQVPAQTPGSKSTDGLTTPGSEYFTDAPEGPPSVSEIESRLESERIPTPPPAEPIAEEEPPQPTEASDDVPLVQSTNLHRPETGGALGSGSSLSRSAGVRGPRAAGPRGPRTSGAAAGATEGVGSHRKAAASIDALKAQFEPAKKVDSSSYKPARRGHRINAGAFRPHEESDT